MRRWTLLVLIALAVSGCGFGLADDSGAAIPGPNYWGWQCADGANATDAGCPVEVDGGEKADAGK